MQDINESETGTFQLDLNKGFKIQIFDTWKFKRVDNEIRYPYYEISYASNTVYISSTIEFDRLKKIIINCVKEICMINYGGGRENPFIEWLSKNAEFVIDWDI